MAAVVTPAVVFCMITVGERSTPCEWKTRILVWAYFAASAGFGGECGGILHNRSNIPRQILGVYYLS